MSIQHHVNDTVPGVAGTTVAGGFTMMGFLSYSMPILQALSLVVGIAVGIVTFLYYWRKMKEEEKVATANIVAEALKARAVVTATALAKDSPK